MSTERKTARRDAATEMIYTCWGLKRQEADLIAKNALDAADGWDRDNDWVTITLDSLAAIEGQLEAVHALIAHARLVSPSERAVIYVADLERALGIDAPVPHKLGGNE